MSSSLQEQLLKSGLVDARQAKKVQAEARTRRKKSKGKGPAPDAGAADAGRRAREDKLARDRELNQRQQAKAARRALVAEVRQLVEQHRLGRDGAEISFHFQDGDTIRKIYVTEAMRRELAEDRLAIVRFGGRYELVPPEVADKIRARDAAFVVTRTVAEGKSTDDDYYARFEVPDDLMW